MAGSWVGDLAALVRLRNLLLSAAGVAIGGVLALTRLELPASVVWAMASAIGLGAAGNIANDLADVEADRLNRPERPLAAGRIGNEVAAVVGGIAGGLGLAAAWWVGARLFWMALGVLLVMLAYSPLLKQRGLAGNLAVAVVAGLPPVYGALAAGWWRAGLVPFGMGAVLHFAREVVKDLEDVPGDRAQGRVTVPIRYGANAAFTLAAATLVLFVPAALAPYFAGWYGRRYGFSALGICLVVMVLVWRLLGRQLAGARAGLKAVMLAGLAALLWDQL